GCLYLACVFKNQQPSSEQPASPVSQYRHASHRARTAEVVGQPQFGAVHLPGARFVPQMLTHFVNHPNTGGTDRMAERLEPAARVDRPFAPEAGATLGDEMAAFAALAEAEVFVVQDFSDGEAVVDLSQIDVGGGDTRLLVGRLRGVRRRREAGVREA